MKTLLVIFALCVAPLAHAIENEDSARMLLHLLGYLGADYGGAVKGGKILSQDEYHEMQEFSHTARRTADQLPKVKADPKIMGELEKLLKQVETKASPETVAATVESIQKDVLRVTGLSVAPPRWPDIRRGQAHFEKNCTQCHGATGHGDGPAAPNQNPPPTNFYGDKFAGVSPFQAFNTIRLGVPGTTMAPFPGLSENEIWDLAFYVVSLRHQSQKVGNVTEAAPLSLETASTRSDAQLLAELPGTPAEKAAAIAATRRHVPPTGSATSLEIAKSELNQAVSYARAEQWVEAQNAAVKAYLDGVEPAEAELRTRDADFTLSLERRMGEVRSELQRRSPIAVLQEKVTAAQAALHEAEKLLAQNSASPAFTFSVAAGIFLREAFEAVLIIITLLGVVRSMGARQAILAIHGGWMLAIGFGVITWFFSGWLIGISGAQREMLEAVTSLVAVTVLLYFGFWLHQRSEIGKWHAFIKSQVKDAVDGGKLFALASVSFLAVFREAFETVIFLRALLIEAGPAQHVAMVAGVLASFVVVIFLAWALVRFSVRLPLRQLFAVSSFIMVLLALILVGKAAHSFQETGLLPVTMLPVGVHFDLFGLYPTYETLIPQLLVVAASFGYWLYTRRVAAHAHR